MTTRFVGHCCDCLERIDAHLELPQGVVPPPTVQVGHFCGDHAPCHLVRLIYEANE